MCTEVFTGGNYLLLLSCAFYPSQRPELFDKHTEHISGMWSSRRGQKFIMMLRLIRIKEWEHRTIWGMDCNRVTFSPLQSKTNGWGRQKAIFWSSYLLYLYIFVMQKSNNLSVRETTFLSLHFRGFQQGFSFNWDMMLHTITFGIVAGVCLHWSFLGNMISLHCVLSIELEWQLTMTLLNLQSRLDYWSGNVKFHSLVYVHPHLSCFTVYFLFLSAFVLISVPCLLILICSCVCSPVLLL